MIRRLIIRPEAEAEMAEAFVMREERPFRDDDLLGRDAG
jgi:hypothetical protein